MVAGVLEEGTVQRGCRKEASGAKYLRGGPERAISCGRERVSVPVDGGLLDLGVEGGGDGEDHVLDLSSRVLHCLPSTGAGESSWSRKADVSS